MKPLRIEQKNVVSPEERVAGETFGGLIPYLVILMCMTGAMYPAMDLTAGEKERATMETILSSPIERTHLVLGKFLAGADSVARYGDAVGIIDGADRSPRFRTSVSIEGVGEDLPISRCMRRHVLAIFR